MTIHAAYIRVSSKAQDHASQRDAIERRGATVTKWFEEKQSAKTLDRPQLKQLLQDARDGLLTDLWIFRLDRLTRSGVADTFKVVSEFRAAGVTIHSVSDGLTIKPTADIVSDAYIFALSLAAQIERTAINERIAAARVRLEAKGEAWGRPSRVSTAQVETMRRMKAAGSSVRDIAQAVGVTKSTVGRLLKAA